MSFVNVYTNNNNNNNNNSKNDRMNRNSMRKYC